MEHQIILDTVNEVSHALLELVPWRAREGLDKLVSDTNERYKATSDTINQRVAEIDAAIQRSQQVGWQFLVNHSRCRHGSSVPKHETCAGCFAPPPKPVLRNPA